MSITDKQREVLIKEVLDQLIIIEGAKDLIKSIQEVAVDKYGDDLKALPAWAASLYKAIYKSESYLKAREKKDIENEVVDSMRS